MLYKIPYGFEMYGRLAIEADSLKEAYEKAENKLEDMTFDDILAQADYLNDSINVDYDGVVFTENGNIINEMI